MNDQFLQAIKEDFPGIEYSLLFQHFLRTVTEWKPEWYSVILADRENMQYWHEHLLPAHNELVGWHQIYRKDHPDAKGYIFYRGKIERHHPNTFFSRVYPIWTE